MAQYKVTCTRIEPSTFLKQHPSSPAILLGPTYALQQHQFYPPKTERPPPKSSVRTIAVIEDTSKLLNMSYTEHHPRSAHDPRRFAAVRSVLG